MQRVYEAHIPFLQPDDIISFMRFFDEKIAQFDSEYEYSFSGTKHQSHGPYWYSGEYRLVRNFLFSRRDEGICGRSKVWIDSAGSGVDIWLEREILNYSESFCSRRMNEIIDLYIAGLNKLRNYILDNSSIVEYRETTIIIRMFYKAVYHVEV